MTLTNDIKSIDAFIAQKFPTATTSHKQTTPSAHVANSFVTRFQNTISTTETAVSWRTEREYQIVYYGAKSADTLAAMDALSETFYTAKVIAKDGDSRFIRVESFAYSAPFKAADSDMYVCIGILRAVTREMRSMATYESANKIMHVNVRLKPE
ncbi:hypothetical protein [Paenibacillus planticolens]|uniref:Uncharacterized protein n=1 Tax=Paenibacillus planticolens TaxID=2654976 RepID=A0ABX1ZFP4_9BACL|nr:hypothetical protein [Paenibacillus planticolens]NOU98482.1 hypothetical protein [Paenibacillus planticolens]